MLRVQGKQLTQDLAAGLAAYEGYRNSPSKALVASVEAGLTYPDAAKEDSQAQSIIKVPVVAARYAGAHSLCPALLYYIVRCIVVDHVPHDV